MEIKKLSKFADVTQVIEEARKAAQVALRPALEEARQALLVADPRIQEIRWRQYTPYFNDGEPCVFDLHGAQVIFGDETDEDLEDEEHEFSYYSSFRHPIYNCHCGCTYIEGEIIEKADPLVRWSYDRRGPGHYEPEFGPHQPSEELSQILGELYAGLDASLDALEAAFGDHVEVSMNVKTGVIETEEYEHD